MQKQKENVFTNTSSPTFIFKTMDIDHPSCLPSYKLSNDISKIVCLHFAIHRKKNMLIKLCVGKYATFDGLVSGVDDLFKTSTI